MNIYLYISKGYFDSNYIKTALSAFHSFSFSTVEKHKDLFKIIKQLEKKIEVVPKEFRFTEIRENSFAVLVFYDGKDEVAESIIKYCYEKNKLLILKHLPYEDIYAE